MSYSEREAKLLSFIAGMACIATGKIRADANAILAEYGLRTIPLAAGPEEARAVQDVIFAVVSAAIHDSASTSSDGAAALRDTELSAAAGFVRTHTILFRTEADNRTEWLALANRLDAAALTKDRSIRAWQLAHITETNQSLEHVVQAMQARQLPEPPK